MTTISISEMMEFSKKLYKKHENYWEHTPESNIYWVSWLVGEIGEMIDIIKKKGADKIMNDKTTRLEMLKEIADCYMYLADILNRYEFTDKEFSKVYREKMNYNFSRDYSKSTTKADKFRITIDSELVSFVKNTSLRDVVNTIEGCGSIEKAADKIVKRFGISKENAERVLNVDWKT